jgi:hypothetical protein
LRTSIRPAGVAGFTFADFAAGTIARRCVAAISVSPLGQSRSAFLLEWTESRPVSHQRQ